ncbi:MAG: ComF family protein [Candidatus Dojkabacteria bacterium]
MRRDRQNRKGVFDVILDVIFPEFCVICDTMGRYICDECKNGKLQKIAGVHSFNPGEDSFLEEVIACVEYEKAAAKVLGEIKYNFYHAITGEIARMMQDRLAKAGITYDYLVPVPLSRKRQNWRGFNQSELIAKKISPNTLNALSRKSFKRPQVGLSRDARLKNVKNAFRLKENIRGKTLVLVDDVMTTGATLESCAAALKRGGAKRVYGLVWARDLLNE